MTVLTLNGGSSSIKFALYRVQDKPELLLQGQIARLGQADTRLTAKDAAGKTLASTALSASDHAQGADAMMDFLHAQGHAALTAIGHRIVHGGMHITAHQLITPALIDELKAVHELDVTHLPREIALIQAMRRRHPQLPQVACFDTVFFTALPHIAQLLPIARKFSDKGVRRLGFHGLSYAYLIQELQRLAPAEADGRVILAHLGAGASMAALRGGQPIDTSMAFTPTAGLMMATRPGDLDPGLLLYLMRVEKLSLQQMEYYLGREFGLAGVSGGCADMHDLLQRRRAHPPDAAAADAVELFCYQARKWIGAYAAALGGFQCLVFAGGIGENSAVIRSEICTGLEFLGLRLDPAANTANSPIISAQNSPIRIRIIATDEQIMIAQYVQRILAHLPPLPCIQGRGSG